MFCIIVSKVTLHLLTYGYYTTYDKINKVLKLQTRLTPATSWTPGKKTLLVCPYRQPAGFLTLLCIVSQQHLRKTSSRQLLKKQHPEKMYKIRKVLKDEVKFLAVVVLCLCTSLPLLHFKHLFWLAECFLPYVCCWRAKVISSVCLSS